MSLGSSSRLIDGKAGLSSRLSLTDGKAGLSLRSSSSLLVNKTGSTLSFDYCAFLFNYF